MSSSIIDPWCMFDRYDPEDPDCQLQRVQYTCVMVGRDNWNAPAWQSLHTEFPTYDDFDSFCGEMWSNEDDSKYDYVLRGDKDYMSDYQGADCMENTMVEDLFDQGHESVLFEMTDRGSRSYQAYNTFYLPHSRYLATGSTLTVKNSCKACYLQIPQCFCTSHGSGWTIDRGEEIAFTIFDGKWTGCGDQTTPEPTISPRPTMPPWSPSYDVTYPTSFEKNDSDMSIGFIIPIVVGVLIGGSIVCGIFVTGHLTFSGSSDGVGQGNENYEAPGATDYETPGTNNYETPGANTGSTAASNNTNNDLPEMIAAMSLGERMDLFQTEFARKQQQFTLDPSWIIAGDSNRHVLHDTNSTGDNKEDDEDIDMALQSTRSALVTTGRGNSTREAHPESHDDDDGSCILVNPTKRTISTHNILHPHFIDPNQDDDSDIPVVSGKCVICLEKMCAGEEVVYSENASCPHLFHKHCMVSFLAHNTQRQQQNRRTFNNMGTKNSCPMCRQNFVTISLPSS